MFDSAHVIPILMQPRRRAESRWNEQEPVGKLRLSLEQFLSEISGDRNSRQVIVSQRRVANVCRNQNFIAAFAGNKYFAVGERALLQARINTYFVASFAPRL